MRPVAPVALCDVVADLGGEWVGERRPEDVVVDRIGPLTSAGPTTLTFLANVRLKGELASTRAACVIVAPDASEIAASRGAAIVTSDPYLYFARLTQWWAGRFGDKPAAGIHPSAAVDAQARVDPSASVGAFAVIEADAEISADAVVGAHCFVGARARVGRGTRLAPHVTLGRDCTIGARGIVHSGVVIGADGFGFAPDRGRWVKIVQLGNVSIGDDVEIGANTCIDRGALDDTLIEDGVKLDNQIQIAHNVRIGAHTAMAACVGVAGSTSIGSHCTIGGAAMISGHLTIADHVHITGASAVAQSIRTPGSYGGFVPIERAPGWQRNAAALRQADSTRDRLRAVEAQVEALCGARSTS